MDMSCSTVIELNPYVDTSANELVITDQYGAETRISIDKLNDLNFYQPIISITRSDLNLELCTGNGNIFQVPLPTLEELQEEQRNRLDSIKQAKQLKKESEERLVKEQRFKNMQYIWI